jgi:hypothetical protein
LDVNVREERSMDQGSQRVDAIEVDRQESDFEDNKKDTEKG